MGGPRDEAQPGPPAPVADLLAAALAGPRRVPATPAPSAVIPSEDAVAATGGSLGTGNHPLAAVVVRPGMNVTAQDLLNFLAPSFAKWWLPDAIEFISEIPRTSVGKFKKSALREQFKDRYGGT